MVGSLGALCALGALAPRAEAQAHTDGGVDGVTDAGVDGTTDAGAAGVTDAGVDGMTDAGDDGLTDAGVDRTTADAAAEPPTHADAWIDAPTEPATHADALAHPAAEPAALPASVEPSRAIPVDDHDDVGDAHEGDAVPVDPPLTFRLGDFVFRPLGEVRARLEVRSRWFGAPADHLLVTSRVRLGIDVRWDVVRAVIQLQDARDLGLTPGASSGGTTGVFQGFLEIGDGASFLRVGRQAIDIGTGRLIGSLNWASAARSFDAVRTRGAIGPLALDVFVALVAPPRHIVAEPYAIDSEGDYVGALTLEWVDPALRLGIDCVVRHDGPHEGDVARRRDVVAFTLRADGAVAPVRYVLETIAQAHAVQGGAGGIAFAAIGEVYVRIAEPWAPELGLGLTYGSGRSPSGSTAELDGFYPSNHQIYGLADLFGLANQAQAFAYGSLTPSAGELSMWAAARVFALPEPTARWTQAGGRTVGVDAANREGFVGGEIDVELRWSPIRAVDLWAGYALFVPGAGGVALGRTDPMHFAYVMLGATFPR